MSFSDAYEAAYAAAASKYGIRIAAATPVSDEDGWADQAYVIASAVSGPTPSKLIFVNKLSDLPAAVSNVITLADDVAYMFTDHIDLLGSRLVCGDTTSILGTTSENASITSTGLTSNPIITATTTFPLRNITITSPMGVLFDGTSDPTTAALDWTAVNFIDCTDYSIRLISPANFIYTDGIVVGGTGIIVEGTTGTVGVAESLFVVPNGETGITIGSSTTINTRFRMTNCSVVVQSGGAGLDVHAAAFPLPERFILNNVNFSGSGTYLGSADSTSNAALFNGCTGITNSASAASYYMHLNATATTITGVSVYAKVAGTTTQSYAKKFTLSNNRATFTGGIAGTFRIVASIALTSGNNNDVDAAIAKNGTVLTETKMRATTSSGGRVESMVAAGIVDLTTNDYIEIWVDNDSSATNITVVDMVVVIEKLSA